MISANADTLVIVKAKNAASKKKIRSALKKYREELIQDETPMTDSGHKIYFPFMTGTYVIRLPYFPAAVNLLASFIFQQIQFCYPANS